MEQKSNLVMAISSKLSFSDDPVILDIKISTGHLESPYVDLREENITYIKKLQHWQNL